jgi:hypothetical protein
MQARSGVDESLKRGSGQVQRPEAGSARTDRYIRRRMYFWIARERDTRRRMYRIRHPEPAPPFTASSTPGRVSMTRHQNPAALH